MDWGSCLVRWESRVKEMLMSAVWFCYDALPCILDYSWPYCVVAVAGLYSKDIMLPQFEYGLWKCDLLLSCALPQKSVSDSKKNVTAFDLWPLTFEFHLFTCKGKRKCFSFHNLSSRNQEGEYLLDVVTSYTSTRITCLLFLNGRLMWFPPLNYVENYIRFVRLKILNLI